MHVQDIPGHYNSREGGMQLLVITIFIDGRATKDSVACNVSDEKLVSFGQCLARVIGGLRTFCLH